MDMNTMLGNYVAKYNTPVDSVMPDVRRMMSTPLIEDTTSAAVTGMPLGEMMKGAYEGRNATIGQYGNLLREDVQNRMAGPTMIQHLATANKNMLETDPVHMGKIEQAKKQGEAQGTALGNINIAEMMPHTPLHPLFAKDSGYASWGDLVRAVGPAHAASMYGQWSRGNAQRDSAGTTAAGEKESAKINAAGAILNNQIIGSLKELKTVDDAIFNAGLSPKTKDQIPALQAQRNEILTRMAKAQQSMAGVGEAATNRVTGRRPAPAAWKSSSPVKDMKTLKVGDMYNGVKVEQIINGRPAATNPATGKLHYLK